MVEELVNKAEKHTAQLKGEMLKLCHFKEVLVTEETLPTSPVSERKLSVSYPKHSRNNLQICRHFRLWKEKGKAWTKQI